MVTSWMRVATGKACGEAHCSEGGRHRHCRGCRGGVAVVEAALWVELAVTTVGAGGGRRWSGRHEETGGTRGGETRRRPEVEMGSRRAGKP